MSSREPDSKPTDSVRRQPTLDGRRIGINELNLGVDPKRGRLQRWLYGVSQFLAGMYTGESCAGTPHSERATEHDQSSQKATGLKDTSPAGSGSNDSARDKRL